MNPGVPLFLESEKGRECVRVRVGFQNSRTTNLYSTTVLRRQHALRLGGSIGLA